MNFKDIGLEAKPRMFFCINDFHILAECPKRKLIYMEYERKRWVMEIGSEPGPLLSMNIKHIVKDMMLHKVQEKLYHTEEYPGRPYCGTKGFAQCNKYHNILLEWRGTIDM